MESYTVCACTMVTMDFGHIYGKNRGLLMKLSHASPTATYPVTCDILHNLHSWSSSPVPNPVSQWDSEEDMPIRPASKQIGERFGRFDPAVRTSSPLPSYLIFTLAPVPTDCNRLLLPLWVLQPHPRILRCSDHPQTRTVP